MKLRFLTPTARALLDYGLSAIQLVAPRVFGFGRGATRIHSTLAVATVAYTATSNHKAALTRELPNEAAKAMDVICGSVLLGSAALLSGQRPLTRSIMASVGLIYLGSAFMSESAPKRHTSPRPATLSPGESPMQRYAHETRPDAAGFGRRAARVVVEG